MAISYAKQIRPLFTDIDIQHMSFFCDLASYTDAKANAPAILGRLRGVTGEVMPPESAGGPWDSTKIDVFQQWMKDGCQP